VGKCFHVYYLMYQNIRLNNSYIFIIKFYWSWNIFDNFYNKLVWYYFNKRINYSKSYKQIKYLIFKYSLYFLLYHTYTIQPVWKNRWIGELKVAWGVVNSYT
jgi:hypothetical protein